MRRLAPGLEYRPVESGLQPFPPAAESSPEVNMLDLFYVAIAIVFFVLLWGFTKTAERL